MTDNYEEFKEWVIHEDKYPFNKLSLEQWDVVFDCFEEYLSTKYVGIVGIFSKHYDKLNIVRNDMGV